MAKGPNRVHSLLPTWSSKIWAKYLIASHQMKSSNLIEQWDHFRDIAMQIGSPAQDAAGSIHLCKPLLPTHFKIPVNNYPLGSLCIPIFHPDFLGPFFPPQSLFRAQIPPIGGLSSQVFWTKSAWVGGGAGPAPASKPPVGMT